MEYADKLEASGMGLPELLNLTPSALNMEYGMKRGHIARFTDRTTVCGIMMPPSISSLPTARRRSSCSSFVTSRTYFDMDSSKSSPAHSVTGPDHQGESRKSFSSNSNARKEKSPTFSNGLKGTAPALPSESRFRGIVGSSSSIKDVASLSVLEKIFVEKVTPEHRPGVNLWNQADLKLPPPMKASDLWAKKPTIILCIRRPGCIMCRAQAHQLYSRKPIFDAWGVQLVAVINEYLEREVQLFWPRFWGGMILLDKNREFFKALGGGILPKESFFTGFIFNRVAWTNYQRAKAMEIESNFSGKGSIKGGLLILRAGRGGVAYQFMERNFGDWAPLEELFKVCETLHQ
ncbi:hypothetical protein KP509_29G022100 [Ceratopteris richardii]|nr:hypothetical protein KP509_29G022100 [Ceratopteris richardii]